MLFHGRQEVRAPDASAGSFEALGFGPGRRWVLAAGVAEAFAGAAALRRARRTAWPGRVAGRRKVGPVGRALDVIR